MFKDIPAELDEDRESTRSPLTLRQHGSLRRGTSHVQRGQRARGAEAGSGGNTPIASSHRSMFDPREGMAPSVSAGSRQLPRRVRHPVGGRASRPVRVPLLVINAGGVPTRSTPTCGGAGHLRSFLHHRGARPGGSRPLARRRSSCSTKSAGSPSPSWTIVMRHGAEPVDRARGEAHAQVAEPLLLDLRLRTEALPQGDRRLRQHPRRSDKIIYAGYFPAGLRLRADHD